MKKAHALLTLNVLGLVSLVPLSIFALTEILAISGQMDSSNLVQENINTRSWLLLLNPKISLTLAFIVNALVSVVDNYKKRKTWSQYMKKSWSLAALGLYAIILLTVI